MRVRLCPFDADGVSEPGIDLCDIDTDLCGAADSDDPCVECAGFTPDNPSEWEVWPNGVRPYTRPTTPNEWDAWQAWRKANPDAWGTYGHCDTSRV